MTASVELAQIDFTDLDNFAGGFPHEPTEHTPDGEGFWSVATHAETLAVFRDPPSYSSVTGGRTTA